MLSNNPNRQQQVHSTMLLPFQEQAFNYRNNTVNIVIELIFILDWLDKNLESIHEMEKMPGEAHSKMRLPFPKWAFNSGNNTVDIVIELIFILDWLDKNLESIHEMEEMPGDALK